MSRKAMKVVVDLQFRAVSCPGVHLSAKDDIYLSVCFMSQYRKSVCLPLSSLSCFERRCDLRKWVNVTRLFLVIPNQVFHYAVDPGDVAEMLELGEALACFEEDARRFLFPEPKLVPSFSGVDREVLMTRSISFPGIAPRLEFFTRTTISECSANAEVNSTHLRSPMRTVVPKKRTKRSRKVHRRGDWDGAWRAPVMPRSRSLSPCKASQMDSCHGNMGRLAQLSLGSSWDIDEEFLPRHKSDPWLGTGHSPTPHLSPVMARPTLTNDSSPRLPQSLSSDTDNLLDYPPGPSQRCSLVNIGRSSTATPSHSMLWHSYRESSRQNGSRPSSQGMWEEVQHRVRGLLTTPRAVHRLAHGATDSEIDEVLARRSISPNRCPP